jgi:hypothetical protein
LQSCKSFTIKNSAWLELVNLQLGINETRS